MFVDLVDGGVDGAQFDEFAGDVFDKAAVGRAAGGGKFGADAADFFGGVLRAFGEASGFGEEGLAGQAPLQIVLQAVAVEYGVHAAFEAV